MGLVAAAAALLLAQQVRGGGSVAAPRSGSSDSFVFASILETRDESDENSEIFIASVSGTSVARLTNYPGPDHSPAWSGDRARIAFASDRDDPGNLDIYTMATDGSDVRRVTSSPAIEGGPAWSPDGRFIAFERATEDGHSQILVVSSEGSPTAVVTPDGLDAADPDWSPDGEKLAFVANVNGQVNVYSLELKTRELRQLTDGTQPVHAPRWLNGKQVLVLTLLDGVPRFGEVEVGLEGPGTVELLGSDANVTEGVSTFAIGPMGDTLVAIHPHVPGMGGVVVVRMATWDAKALDVPGRLLSGVDW